MPTTNSSSLNETVAEIVLRFVPRERAGMVLRPETDLIDDAGIDSPRMIDIVLEIEDRIGCVIEDREVQKIRSFGDLVSLIESLP
jgi:acyl carrier protein